MYFPKAVLFLIAPLLCPPQLSPVSTTVFSKNHHKNELLSQWLQSQHGPAIDLYPDYTFRVNGLDAYRDTHEERNSRALGSSFDQDRVAVLTVDASLMPRESDTGGILGGPTYSFSRTGIIREFYRTHGDDYDSVFLFFHEEAPDGGAFARGGSTNTRVRGVGDFRGVGDKFVDANPINASRGRLQGTASMNCICYAGDNPFIDFFEIFGASAIGYTLMDVLAQEWGHRQLSYPMVQNPDGDLSTALLGRGLAHWSFFSDTGGSPLEGSHLEEISNNLFESLPTKRPLSDLDLYLLGYLPSEKVRPFFYVDQIIEQGQAHNASSFPEIGPVFFGRRQEVIIKDVITAMGPRIPAPNASRQPVKERHAFILVVPDDVTLDPVRVEQMNEFAKAWEKHFKEITQGRAVVDTRIVSRDPATLPPAAVFLTTQQAQQGSSVSSDALVLHAQNLDAIEVEGDGVTAEILSVSGEVVTIEFTVSTSATPGPRNVVFLDSAGEEQVAIDFFTVAPVNAGPAPYTTFSRINTAFGATIPPGAEDNRYQLFGRFFQPGLSLEVSGVGVTLSDINVIGDTFVEARIDVDENAPTGFRDIIVQNPDGGTEILTNILAVAKNPEEAVPGGPLQINSLEIENENTDFAAGCAIGVGNNSEKGVLFLFICGFVFAYVQRKHRTRFPGEN